MKLSKEFLRWLKLVALNDLILNGKQLNDELNQLIAEQESSS